MSLDDPFLRDWVRPRAGDIDRRVDALREALTEMGRRGLLGLRIPREFGGRALDALEFRRYQESLARASGALAFLESQHQSACGLIAKSPNADLKARVLPRLARGDDSAAIAFSHLRRSGPPVLVATPQPGGHRLDGHLPWVTGWGLFSHCVTAASLPDGRVLFAFHRLEALEASAPMELAAMGVTQTVSAEARGLFVPDRDVVEIHPASWIQENDRIAVALQSPLALGCALAALDVLRDAARTTSIREAAERLEAELAAVREEAYRTMEDHSDFARSLRARSAAIEFAGRAAHAAVLAAAGAGNLVTHAAQRVWREALAFSVLALMPPLQEAAILRLAAKG